MTTPHRATPEQWALAEQYAEVDCYSDACILELRDRLAAAEQRIGELEGNHLAKPDSSVPAIEMPHLTNEEADALHEGPGDSEDSEACARRIYRVGWDAAMAAVAAQQHDHLRPAPEMVPAATRRPLQEPSANHIAECGGPCQEGFWHCDCGLLEQLNPDLRPAAAAPAGSLVEDQPVTTPPPLGLRPRWLAIEQRLVEVQEAIARYRAAGWEPDVAWVNEERQLIGECEHERNWQKVQQPAPSVKQSLTDAPAGSLVEVVGRTWSYGQPLHPAATRAAILACADWLERQDVGAGHAAARWLREEVERG